jgi:hypothetical protein
MLSISCLGACPSGDPNALAQKLTSIKVGPIQPIDDATAQGIANELVTTVQCNAEEAARKVILPAVIVAGIAAVGAGLAALMIIRHRPEALAGAKRTPYKRPKKEREPVFFVDPETGDVIELEHSTAEYKKLHGRRALGTRYRVTVRYRKFPTPTSLCVEAPNRDEAVALVSGGAKGIKIVRVVRGC